VEEESVVTCLQIVGEDRGGRRGARSLAQERGLPGDLFFDGSE